MMEDRVMGKASKIPPFFIANLFCSTFIFLECAYKTAQECFGNTYPAEMGITPPPLPGGILLRRLCVQQGAAFQISCCLWKILFLIQISLENLCRNYYQVFIPNDMISSKFFMENHIYFRPRGTPTSHPLRIHPSNFVPTKCACRAC